jgi:hypothetical protein
MKQLSTTKHIIFVILLLVIILSLFRGNIVEGYKRRLSRCDQIWNQDECNKYKNIGCNWHRYTNNQLAKGYDEICRCRHGNKKDEPCNFPN